MVGEGTTSTVPCGELDRDRITPHKISILVLIKEFCTAKMKLLQINIIKPFEAVPVHTTRQKRDMAIVLLRLIQSQDTDLNKLTLILQPITNARTYQLFLDRLLELRKGGISGLMDQFMTGLESLIVDPVRGAPIVHKSSYVGLFLRRMMLAFDKLSFAHVTKLHSKFCSYYDAAFRICPLMVSLAEKSKSHSFQDSDLSDDSESEENQLFASQKQAELFIAHQISYLQINEKEAYPPPKLQSRIRDLLKGNPTLTEAHYLSFMNSLRVREFCGAVENLYHHFDRNTSVPIDNKSASTSDEASCAFRYAALNLAILHARFGHKEVAMAALKEAIMVSQEVNDNICLQHALSWYYRLLPDDDESTEILIERSVTKTPELNLWYLASLGIQALAKMKCVTTALPSNIFDLAMKSDILNCQHSMTDVMGCAYVQKAAMWVHYGNFCMSNLVSQMLLYLNTADNVHGGVYHVGEGTCLALRNVAQVCSLECNYQFSTALLSFSKDLFPAHSEYNNIWKAYDLTMNFEMSLHAGKWTEAEKLLQGIEIIDLKEALYRKAQLSMGRGDAVGSHEVIKSLISICKTEKVSPHFQARVMLLRATLLMQTPNSTMALHILLTCLELCKTHFLLHLEAQCLLLIAQYQFALGLPKLALVTLEGAFITILSQGSYYDKGSCYLLYARCLAASVTSNNSEENTKKVMFEAAGACDKSAKYFWEMKAYHKAKYAYCWLAHLYNTLGNVEKRNYYAHKYRVIDLEFQWTNWNSMLVL